VEVSARQRRLIKILARKLDKNITKLKRNLVSLRIPVEQHIFLYANIINETFGAWECYINTRMKEKEVTQVSKIPSNSRHC